MPLDLKNLTISGAEPRVMLIRTGAKTLCTALQQTRILFKNLLKPIHKEKLTKL